MRDLRTGAKGGRARGEIRERGASEGGEELLKQRQQPTIFNLAHCCARFPNVLPHPALSP